MVLEDEIYACHGENFSKCNDVMATNNVDIARFGA